MPNIVGVQLNTADSLLVIMLGNGAVVVTRAEAQAWIDARPNSTTAQIEAQINSLINARWPNKADVVALHLISRNPVTFTLRIADPGTAIPANWWAE